MKSNLLRTLCLVVFIGLTGLKGFAQEVHRIENTAVDTLMNFINDTEAWSAGDIILLSSDSFAVSGTMNIPADITIMGDPALAVNPIVYFLDNGFQVTDDSVSVKISGIDFVGNPEGAYAPFIIRYTGGSSMGHYDYVILEDIKATGFRGGIDLNASKERYYHWVELNNVYFSDFTGQEWVIDPNLNAVDELRITNSTFSEVGAVLKNVYHNNGGGGVFGDVIQTIVIDRNTFYKIGDNNNSLIQMNDPQDGNIDLTFSNNIVSGILSETGNTRSFRLSTTAGSFKFMNSHFHDFVSSDPNKDQLSLDSIAIDPAYDLAVSLTEVTLSGSYPEFKDTTSLADPKSFILPANSVLRTAGTDGGAIGDPRWLSTEHEVSLDLEAFIENTSLWSAGDTIILTEPEYLVTGSIDIWQSIVLMGDPSLTSRPVIKFTDNGLSVKDDSINIAIVGVDFIGNPEGAYAPFIVRYSGGSSMGHYDYVILKDIYATGFRGGVDLNASKQRYYHWVELNNVYFNDFTGQEWVIDPNLNAVDELRITNSTFSEVGAVLKNVYHNNSGSDVFGNVPQKIVIDHNTFYKIGDNNNSLIQLNDPQDGNIDLTFSNNIVSGILSETGNTRSFRLSTTAGAFKFENSHFHDFVSSDPTKDQLSLDSIAIDPAYDLAVSLSNVTLSGVYPEFKDTTAAASPKNFSIPLGSSLLTAGSDGGPIGDPRWSATSKMVSTNLEAFVEDTTLWNAGDTIYLTKPEYTVVGSIDVLQSIVIMKDPSLSENPVVTFLDNGFHVKDDTINIAIKGVDFVGKTLNANLQNRYAAFVLRYSGGSTGGHYDYAILEDVKASGFKGGIDLNPSKNRYYHEVTLNNVFFSDFTGQEWVIDPNINVVKELNITNSTFSEVGAVLKNVYFNNGGSGEFGDVIQDITVDHNTFYKIGDNNNSLIQLNDQNDGNLNVKFSANIVSGILSEVGNTRSFRLNPLGGVFAFENSYFHDFVSADPNKDQFSLDSIAVDSNYDLAVSLSDVVLNGDDPEFADVPSDFSIDATSPAYLADGSGGYIGDPRWLPNLPGLSGERIHPIPNATDSLENFIELHTDLWDEGDTILLVSPGTYFVRTGLQFYQGLTILGDPSLSSRPEIRFYGDGMNIQEDTMSIIISDVRLNGLHENDSDRASYLLNSSSSGLGAQDSIIFHNVDAENFNFGIELYRGGDVTYDLIEISDSYFENIGNWILDPRTNGAVSQTTVVNSTFVNISNFLKNYYNNNNGTDGDLGDIAMNIKVDHNTFYKVGDILIQTNDSRDGQLSVTFSNNIVSTLLNTTTGRPFRIEHIQAGAFDFESNVFHDFDSDRASGGSVSGYNIDSLAELSNVTLTNYTKADPGFISPDDEPISFSYSLDSDLNSYATDGGQMGDPRWYPSIGVSIVPVEDAVVALTQQQMEAVVTFGSSVTDLTVSWSVINGTGSASIDSNGLLSAESAGEVWVKAVSNHNPLYADSVIVTIVPPTFVSAIALRGESQLGSPTESISQPGGSIKVLATVLPGSATDKSIEWSLDDESLATVLELNATSILLTAVASGNVTVTASATDGSGVTGEIIISLTNQNKVESVTVTGESTVLIGETTQLTATVSPENVDNDSLTWTSSSTGVATVDANGLVTAVAAGTTTITARATDGSFKAGTLEVTVVPVLGNIDADIATLYPNPATNYIQLNLNGSAKVEVMSLSGQLILDKVIDGSAKVDITGLESGIYMMRITQGNKAQQIKFVKQ